MRADGRGFDDEQKMNQQGGQRAMTERPNAREIESLDPKPTHLSIPAFPLWEDDHLPDNSTDEMGSCTISPYHPRLPSLSHGAHLPDNQPEIQHYGPPPLHSLTLDPTPTFKKRHAPRPALVLIVAHPPPHSPSSHYRPNLSENMLAMAPPPHKSIHPG